MLFYAVIFGVIIVCLGAMLAIASRKFPQLTLIDTAALPKEKETQKKKQIMDERVRRMAGEWRAALVKAFTAFFERLQQGFRRQYRKLLSLEKKYAPQPPAPAVSAEEMKAKAVRALEEASALAGEGKFEEAERKYVEAVKLDRTNVGAYRGLGDLYMSQKDYVHAKETYAYLVKASVRACCAGRRKKTAPAGQIGLACDAPPADLAEIAKNYLSLALACRALGDGAGAKLALENAVAHEPANPKHLDLLIEACILEGDKERAFEVFRKLKEVNPDNQKLGALYERISAIPAGSVLKSEK